MKKLACMFLTITMIITFSIPVFASDHESITFDEYYAALQAEYKKYNINFTIENPNLDFNYTKDFLNEELKKAQIMDKSIHQVSDEELAALDKSENLPSVTPYVMAKNYAFTDDYTINAETIAGYCYVQMTCTGQVDIQNDTVISARPTAKRKAGMNVRDSSFEIDATRDGGMVRLLLDGTVTFEYTNPITSDTFIYDAYGPFQMIGFQADAYLTN